MQKILGISGRAQAGKDTIANWLTGLVMQDVGIIEHHYVNEQGKLVVPIITEGEVIDAVLQFDRETLWLKENVYPHVKQYQIAYKLKEICRDLFGLTYEQTDGTNEDKDAPCGILWQGIAPHLRKKYNKKTTDEMSSRELQQVFGSEIIREIYNDAWANECINRVLRESSEWAFIKDVRFPNEVDKIHEAGGMVVRLTRNPLSSDHKSEIALDQDKYDWNNFDAIIDNAQMDIGQQNKAIFEILTTWGWVDYTIGDLDE